MVLDKHAPTKKNIVRGNEVPLMAKELSKAIMKDLNLRIDIQNDYLVETSWPLRGRRISVRILTKRR